MRALVLDTGALIALERDQQRLRAFLRAARARKWALRTSAPALTEFLGHAPRARRQRADHVASAFAVGGVNEASARRAAALLRGALDEAPRAKPSAVDALGVAEAEALQAQLVFDGDRADFDALAQASGSVRIVALPEII